jgi:hypothetical protein
LGAPRSPHLIISMARTPTKEQINNAVEMKAFLVVMSSYEYDDEYNRVEEGVDPQAVYFDEDAAKKAAKILSKVWMAEQDEDYWEDGIPDDMFHVIPVAVGKL